LGCFLTLQPKQSQVEVNKQAAEQNAAAVGTGNTVYQQGSYQNQLDYQVRVITIPKSEPQLQISNQDAKQNGANCWSCDTVFQDLDQSNIQKQVGFNFKVVHWFH